MRRMMVILTIATAATARPAAAALHIWIGVGDGVSWNDSANWLGGVPTSNESGGTVVQFGSGTTTTDNIAGLKLDLLHFTGGGNVVNGNGPLLLAGGVTSIQSDSGTNTLGSSLAIQDDVDQFFLTVASGQLNINGVISGPGALKFTGPGTLRLNGANTYATLTIVLSGLLQLGGASTTVHGDIQVGSMSGVPNSAMLKCLTANQIAPGGIIQILNDGFVDLNTFPATFNKIHMTGGVLTTSNTLVTLTGPIEASGDGTNPAKIIGYFDLGGTPHTFDVTDTNNGVDLQMDVSLIGVGATVNKIGAGTLEMIGTQPNNYSGTTTVQNGTMYLSKNGVTSVAGPLVINDGSVLVRTNEQIADASDVTVNVGGAFAIDGATETIGNLHLTASSGSASFVNVFSGGKLVLSKNVSVGVFGNGALGANVHGDVELAAGTRTFTVADGPGDEELFIERLMGPGSLIKAGPGRMRIGDNSPFAGPTAVNGGELLLQATLPSTFSVNAGGTLGGSGTIGASSTTSQGHISPGLAVISGFITTSFSMNGGTFDVTVNNNSADRITSTSPISLVNASLVVSILSPPPIGQQLTILRSTTGTTIGTFNGLPDGSMFSAGGTTFRINYNVAAGSNHDVTLTVLAASVPTMPEWMAIVLGAALLGLAARKISHFR